MSLPNLHIAATKNTPEVFASIEDQLFKVVGASFPENSRKFYDPLMSWVEESKKHCTQFTIDIELSYVSSSSLITFLNLLKKFQSLYGAGNVTLKWRYEEDDDDLLKIIEDYKRVINFKVELIIIEE
jgi:hypothetical protein